ncbi:MAG TPA: gliding motility-associated C-terminal domain-containing protein [Saprospiraceae bacterium]
MKTPFFILSILFLIYCSNRLNAQTYFSTGSSLLYKITVNSSQCSCTYDELPSTFPFWPEGITFLPDTTLVVSDHHLFTLDTLTGIAFQFFTHSDPSLPYFRGLLGIGNGIFYQLSTGDDKLYRINTITGEVIFLGSTGYDSVGDITLYNGNIYYPYLNGIVLLDTNNTANSYPIVTYSDENYLYPGLTASHVCNSLIGIGWTIGSDNVDISLINLADGAITHLCMLPQGLTQLSILSSMLEFSTSSPCNIQLDLDCNDSSGAADADFNSPIYNCLSDGVIIADEDITMEYDAIISTMTVSVSGNEPDAPYEILVSTGVITGIDVDGSGTGMITLTNTGGARSTDFKNALRFIRYQNIATPLTPGPRTVEVMFTTESGAESNIAIAFIDVISSPVINVDLGPDVQYCEGQSATFDAGHPGAMYTWSTGSHSQTITADDSGLYSVTVTNGIHCPNADTVELEILPVITIALSGDTELCDNETANLSIQTNTPFALDIDVDVSPGSPFHFEDVTGDLDFIDLISQPTTYTITSVTPVEDACLDITDSIQIIDIYPAYVLDVDVALCDGDSVWLGFYWETEAGVYENVLTTDYGCDSVVTAHITILPAIQMTAHSTTCDTAAAGVFITYLDNPNGCDTVVTSIVTLITSDTTFLFAESCILTTTGVVYNASTGTDGCDSIIVTTTSWILPADTTFLSQYTCDSAQVGVSQLILTAQDGCDSLIITTITIPPTDTIYIHGISCDSAVIGISQMLLSNAQGCDSLVITSIVSGVPDTTYLFSTSCDSSSLGIFETHFITAQQCDSTVISTVSYSAQDSTFITGTTCDPAQEGVFIEMLKNMFGCDSIVTHTITLSPSDVEQINSTTCIAADTGVFTFTLVNQFGCDSIVTETVTLLPSDATSLFGTTCDVAQAGTHITNHVNQYGCDSIVTLTITLLPSDTTLLLSGTCDPAQTGSTETLYTGLDGCDSLVMQIVSLFPLPVLDMVVTSDFNGYPISCFGAHDGRIQALVQGEDPFEYFWTTGDTTQAITGLGAGDYGVSISDANGCETAGQVILEEPGEFGIGFEISQPDCFSNQTGTITVSQTGGVLPVQYSIDGIHFQSSPTFTDLTAGSYTISAIDANDCETKEIIMINVFTDILVDLGDDLIIMPGDTAIINAWVNVPFDSLASVTWSGLTNPPCPTCLSQMAVPVITSAYSIVVSDVHGCADEDSMFVHVQHDADLYIPNVFSPNEDGINDLLLISAGAAVERIESFSIFDRWGNMIFFIERFSPNDASAAWDGKRNGVPMQPGVYAYKMVVAFTNGTTEIRHGDVTLIR